MENIKIWHEYDIKDIKDMPDPEKDILVRYNEDCWDTTKINPEDWEDGFCEFIQEWAYVDDLRATSKALAYLTGWIYDKIPKKVKALKESK